MYVTYWNPPKMRQITFEEILMGVSNLNQMKLSGDETSTRTICVKDVPRRLLNLTDVPAMIQQLKEFNMKWTVLINEQDLGVHYRHFSIPKRDGGWRPIDAPDTTLSDALIELRDLLKSFMIADYHTAAHAYIQNRSIITAVKAHVAGHPRTVVNQETGEVEVKAFPNNWKVSLDFHGFFPSTTPDFVFGMLSTIYPFNLIMRYSEGGEQLRMALRLAFLRGGLPQGTPMSPWLTNVMMIPFDHLMSRKLSKLKMADGVTRQFTYTRYADDLHISCYLSFDPMEIQEIVIQALKFFNAPFCLNESKTRYGNRNSSENWMLGLMWNQNNEITVGWRNMKTFKAMVTNYIGAKKDGKDWDLEEVQHFNGLISYYKMVNRNATMDVIKKYNAKFHVNVEAMIHDDLTPKSI